MIKTHLNAMLQSIRNILSQTYCQLGENLHHRQSGNRSLCRILSVCLIIIKYIYVLDYDNVTRIYSCRSAMGNKHMAGAVEV